MNWVEIELENKQGESGGGQYGENLPLKYPCQFCSRPSFHSYQMSWEHCQLSQGMLESEQTEMSEDVLVKK